MKRKYAAFDIEIARVLPDGEGDWKAYRPLGITCVAIALSDREEPLVFHGLTTDEQAADRFSLQTAQELVSRLLQMVGDGYTILTWNGLGFDFDVLAEESQRLEECSWLALNHVDMMFHLFCQLGYGVGLDRAAKAMGLAGKPEGMSGALAPRLWANGRRQEVLDYVAQDARTTLELARICEERGYLRWITHSGNVRTVALPRGWLNVGDAMNLPEPDTSWMSNPWPRSKFTGWLVSSSNSPINQNTLVAKAGPSWMSEPRRIDTVTSVKCRNSHEHKVVLLPRGKESVLAGSLYLCLDCGATKLVTEFVDVDSDVSKLTGDTRVKALDIIRSDPISKERLLKSENPCVFRPRVERGNPYTPMELDEMADQEMGRRLSMLEEGEYDYDEHGDPITDIDYYLP